MTAARVSRLCGGVIFYLNDNHLYLCRHSDGDIPSIRLKNCPKADWSGKLKRSGGDVSRRRKKILLCTSDIRNCVVEL